MRPTQKRMRDGKVNHLQNTYTNLRIRPKLELFPTEWKQKLSKTQNCTNFTGLWYWTTNPVGAIQTRNFFCSKNTRSNTIRLHHTNISNFTNKQTIWNTQLHKNKTLHNGLALFKTMTNLTTHPADKPQHIRNNLEFFFLPHTWHTAYHHQPSSPERF